MDREVLSHFSLHLSFSLCVDLSMYLSICRFIYRCFCLAVRLSIYLSIYRSIHPSMHPSTHPYLHPSIHPSIHPLNHLYLFSSFKNLTSEHASHTAVCTISTSPRQVFLTHVTWKSASHHSSVLCLDNSTSEMVWDHQFSTLFTRRCASRHRQRHSFQQLPVQKWSETGRFEHFSLRHLLRSKIACTFWTPQGPKLLWSCCVLCLLTSTCASRRGRMHFPTSQLPKAVRHRSVLCMLASESVSRQSGVWFWCLGWPDGSAPVALESLLLHIQSHKTWKKTQCFATFLPLRAPQVSFYGSAFD